MKWSAVADTTKLRIRDLAMQFVKAGAILQEAQVRQSLELAFIGGTLDDHLQLPLARWPPMVKLQANLAAKEKSAKFAAERLEALQAAQSAAEAATAEQNSVSAMERSAMASAKVHWLKMQES